MSKYIYIYMQCTPKPPSPLRRHNTAWLVSTRTGPGTYNLQDTGIALTQVKDPNNHGKVTFVPRECAGAFSHPPVNLATTYPINILETSPCPSRSSETFPQLFNPSRWRTTAYGWRRSRAGNFRILPLSARDHGVRGGCHALSPPSRVPVRLQGALREADTQDA